MGAKNLTGMGVSGLGVGSALVLDIDTMSAGVVYSG